MAEEVNVQVLRYAGGEDDTLGLMMVDGQFVCYTLEDEFRTNKVYGETRIPSGNYRLTLRTTGGFHKRYKKKFGELHEGMIWIMDVPNFEYVLIHIGNRDDDTAGCILVGDSINNNLVEEGFVSHSAQAYRRIYSMLLQPIKENRCSITLTEI